MRLLAHVVLRLGPDRDLRVVGVGDVAEEDHRGDLRRAARRPEVLVVLPGVARGRRPEVHGDDAFIRGAGPLDLVEEDLERDRLAARELERHFLRRASGRELGVVRVEPHVELGLGARGQREGQAGRERNEVAARALPAHVHPVGLADAREGDLDRRVAGVHDPRDRRPDPAPALYAPEVDRRRNEHPSLLEGNVEVAPGACQERFSGFLTARPEAEQDPLPQRARLARRA